LTKRRKKKKGEKITKDEIEHIKLEVVDQLEILDYTDDLEI
jgi:hypothetical protein